MFAKAEAEINAVVAELGESAPMKMPDTAYYLSCIYAYLGKKVTTLGELRDTLADVKAMMTREYKTKDIFTSGVGTAIAAEMIEACKYARNPDPYAGTNYHGHFTDAEVRTLGVPLVTRDIPGFVVMIGPAPTKEEALETVKGYQSRGIFVFLIGGIIDQLIECGMTMNFDVRVVPVGEDIWSVGHIISLVVRAAFIFGAVQPGDYDGHIDYSFHRIFAFVNAYAPVPDITVACGAGAIQLGFPVITNDTDDMWAVPKSLIINENTQDWIETSLEARDIKIKVTNIDIPVAFSNAFEGEIIRKNDTQIEIDGSRVDCCEFCRTEEAQNIEDHAIILDGPDFDEFEPGSKICLTITLEVAGKSWQTDFEPVVERKFHNFLNCIEGVMHTGQRDMIRVRVSKSAFEAGFRARHLGEVLYAKVKGEYETVVDKCQVRICTRPEGCKEIRAKAKKSAMEDDVQDEESLCKLIESILSESEEDEMYASELKGVLLRLRPQFNEKTYGCATFGKLLAKLSTHFGTIRIRNDSYNVMVSLVPDAAAPGAQESQPLRRDTWQAAFAAQLQRYKDDGFERINPSILKADIISSYPDFTEKSIGFRRFSDILKQLEKDGKLKLEMDSQRNMLIKML